MVTKNDSSQQRKMMSIQKSKPTLGKPSMQGIIRSKGSFSSGLVNLDGDNQSNPLLAKNKTESAASLVGLMGHHTPDNTPKLKPKNKKNELEEAMVGLQI